VKKNSPKEKMPYIPNCDVRVRPTTHEHSDLGQTVWFGQELTPMKVSLIFGDGSGLGKRRVWQSHKRKDKIRIVVP